MRLATMWLPQLQHSYILYRRLICVMYEDGTMLVNDVIIICHFLTNPLIFTFSHDLGAHARDSRAGTTLCLPLSHGDGV